MKKAFTRTALFMWLSSFVRNHLPLARRTPWYRRTLVGNVPWIAPALMTPFVVFVLWKGASLLWRRSRSET